MTPWHAVIGAAVLIAGCQTGPRPSLFKAGSTFPQRQADYDQCKIASLQQIPQALTTQQVGGYYNPGTTQCSAIGSTVSCNQVGRINIAPTSVTSDENGSLRQRFIERCMGEKGYAVVDKPSCPTEKERLLAINSPQPSSLSEFKCNSGRNLDE